jgi:hypothetical protein
MISKLTANAAQATTDAATDRGVAAQIKAQLVTQEGTLAAAKTTLASEVAPGVNASKTAIDQAKSAVDKAQASVESTKTYLGSIESAGKARSTAAADDERQLKLQQDVQKVEQKASTLDTTIKAGLDIKTLPPQAMKGNPTMNVRFH